MKEHSFQPQNELANCTFVKTILMLFVVLYVHVTVNFIAAISISLLISFLLMKFKWTRTLIGENKKKTSII